MTAHSEAGSGVSGVGHPEAMPLSSVQQHLRNFSAQSLSGFSDPGTPLWGAADSSGQRPAGRQDSDPSVSPAYFLLYSS